MPLRVVTAATFCLMLLPMSAMAQSGDPFEVRRPRIRLSQSQDKGLRIGVVTGILSGTAAGVWQWSKLDRENCGMACIGLIMTLPVYAAVGATAGAFAGGIIGLTIGTIAGRGDEPNRFVIGVSARIRIP